MESSQAPSHFTSIVPATKADNLDDHREEQRLAWGEPASGLTGLSFVTMD